jgi:hypothetical protein
VGTWDIDPPGIGAAVGQLVVDALQGTVSPGTLTMAPLGRFISRHNLAEWSSWEQRVAYSQLQPW